MSNFIVFETLGGHSVLVNMSRVTFIEESPKEGAILVYFGVGDYDYTQFKLPSEFTTYQDFIDSL